MTVGSPFSLTVSATGSNLTYQWQKNGSNLIGATNATLAFPNPQLADTGVYVVQASNIEGSDASVPATVSVLNNIVWLDNFSTNPLVSGWAISQYLPLGGFSWQAINHTFTIENVTANDSTLHRSVTGLLPNHNYRLHAWVMGDQITGGGIGANISQWNQNVFNNSHVNADTFGWTNLDLLVTTDATGQVEFGCRLGHFGSTVTGSATFGNLALEEFLTLTNPTRPTVRVAYVIPSNRAPQTNGVTNLRNVLVQWQAWYRDQMERNKFGPKTFQFETEADGITPKIHIIAVADNDAAIRGSGGYDEYYNVSSAAANAGVPVNTPKQVWLLVPEAHLMLPDSSVIGGVFLGAGGAGDDSGTAVVDSTALARLDPSLLINDTNYAGLVWPAIGPYPMTNATTFVWFEGDTFSSISSSAQGGALHELSHAFGLSHDYRNDANFNGNLMYNGCRGFRGNFYPARYPADQVHLSYAAALVLNTSRYFNPETNYADQTPPAITITSGASQTPFNGQIQISFTATDNVGLASALLQFNDSEDVIGEMPLSGLATNAVFTTPYFNAGQTTTYAVAVYDTSGNRTISSFTITIGATSNQAPQLYLKLSPASAAINQPVVFDASQTLTPNGVAGLSVQWDFNGDGTYDTVLSTNLVVTNSFNAAGLRLVRARAVDMTGATSVSTLIDERIFEPRLQLQRVGGSAQVSWPVWMTGFNLQAKNSLAAPGLWQAGNNFSVLGMTNLFTEPTAGMPQRFFRLARP